MIISKKVLMTTANKIAKLIVSNVGDYEVAMKLALKDVWYMTKRYNKHSFNAVSIYNSAYYLTAPQHYNKLDGVIPMWFVNERGINPSNIDDWTFIRETKKAKLAEFKTVYYGDIFAWIPKSILA